MFTYETTVKLHQTDAAGVCFFGNYFHIAHDGYEAFMASIDYSLRYIIDTDEDVVLIVHAEADYKKPTFGGDKVVVQTTLQEMGRTSFTLRHTVLDQAGDVAAIVTTVHVAVNKESKRSVRLNERLVAGLKTIQG
jgi:1,4-dihydroxy-2-naphthoyl-CoA hydrolase